MVIPKEIGNIPSTRYQGSKRKILPWIYDCIKDVEFNTVLDAFGGSGMVSCLFKHTDEGQGDPYEGVYSNVITEENKRLRPDSVVVMIKGKPYLRSKSIVEKWPCLSFYCASELTDSKEENGVKIYEMAKDYIESFCEGETFESMLK